MATGIKLGIIALENSGKTTLAAQLEDALVVSTDNKAFKGAVPHYRYTDYQGFEHFAATLEDKLAKYEERFKTLPRNIVVDSVSHLANNMERYCNEKYTGFNIWSALGKDTLALNDYFEQLNSEGINVIFTSHCQYDPDTLKYKISAPGSFGKNGSWLSVTDNAVFIEIKGNKRIVHHTTMKFPCRSNLADLPESEDMDSYNINKHIGALEANAIESEEWVLN